MCCTKPYPKVKISGVLTQRRAAPGPKLLHRPLSIRDTLTTAFITILVWIAPQCITWWICKSSNIFLSTDHPIVGGCGSYLDTIVETLILADLLRKFTRHSNNWPYLTFTVIDESKMWLIRYLPVKKFSATKYNMFQFQSMQESFMPTTIWWPL